MKLACVTCHASAPASTKPTDNNLPPRAICLNCHKDATIPMPRASFVESFNHALHLKLGNLGPVIAAAIDSKSYLAPPGDIRRHLDSKNPCAACHRGLEESTAVTAAAMPQMADCLVCHNKIDPPFSCETCHSRSPRLKPASHTPDYIDLHNSKKIVLDKQSCAVCHGRKFSCLGCH